MLLYNNYYYYSIQWNLSIILDTIVLIKEVSSFERKGCMGMLLLDSRKCPDYRGVLVLQCSD